MRFFWGNLKTFTAGFPRKTVGDADSSGIKIIIASTFAGRKQEIRRWDRKSRCYDEADVSAYKVRCGNLIKTFKSILMLIHFI